MRSRRKVQNRMSVLKRTGKKNVLALALAIAMVSSTVAGEPLSIHAYADETNAISSSDDGSSKSSGKTEQVKEEKTSSKEEKTEAKTEKASEERSTGKSETSAAAKSAIKIVTEAENSAASDTKSSDVKIGFSENTEKSNASGQKSSGSSDNTSATSATEKSTEASNAGSSASGESSTEKATETKTNTSDAETKSSTASSDTNSSTENTSSASNGANGSAAGTGTSTGAGETTAPETNATETSATETTAAVETTAVETIAPETTAELDEEAQKKAESARIRKGILAADTAARKAKLGKTGSWKSSIFDFVKHLFYINVVADAENEADDVEDESISEMEVSEDDIDDYSVDLGKDYTANVVDDEDHVSGKNCFTSIIMARKVSGKWKAQSEFHDGDSVRVSLAVSIPSDAMDEDSRVFYYQMPSAVTISEEQSGLMKRDDIVIGKYVLTEDGMLVVKLTDNISVNQKFRGIIVFDAELAKDSDQTMEKIDFGSFVFILHDGVSNDSKGGDAEDVDDETDETEPTDTVEDDANKKATSSEIAEDGELNTRSGLLKVSNRIVTATANYPAGTFPIGTKMQVVRVKKPSELKTLKTKVDAQLESENSGKIAKDIYAYDISFIYDGEKIEPLNPVDISLQFNKSQGKPKATKAEDPEKAEWKMFHATEDGEIAVTESTDTEADVNSTSEDSKDSEDAYNSETTEETNTTDLVTENSVLHDITTDATVSTNSDNTTVHKVDFSSDAFSVYVLAYTVDFHYGDYEWSLEGGQSILLSVLFTILGIEKDILDVESVTFSNTNLVSVEKIESDYFKGSDWRLMSQQAFDSHELLSIYFSDGEIITVDVTDDKETIPGIDFGQYIKNATVQVKDSNGNWVDATSIVDGEDTKFFISYQIPANTLSASNNTIYYYVPEQITLSKEQNGIVYDENDSKKEIGTYKISKKGLITITFNDKIDYASNINGKVEFRGKASVKNATQNYTISFNGKTIEVKIPESRIYNIKTEKDGTLNSDHTAVSYKVVVSSTKGTGNYPITVHDSVNKWYGTLKSADYDQNSLEVKKYTSSSSDGVVIEVSSYDISFQKWDDANNKCPEFTIKNLPALSADERYEITYVLNLTPKDTADGSGFVANTVWAKFHETQSSADCTKNWENVIAKDGKYDADNNKIHWTITINNQKTNLKGWKFSDELPGSLVNGSNSVIMLSEDKQESITIPVTNGKLEYTFTNTDNYKTYTIEYDTVAPETENGVKVSNTAHLDKYYASKDVDVTNNHRKESTEKKFSGDIKLQDGLEKLTWYIKATLPEGNLSDYSITDVIGDSNDSRHYGLRSEIDDAIKANIKLETTTDGTVEYKDFSDKGFSLMIEYYDANNHEVKSGKDTAVKRFVVTLKRKDGQSFSNVNNISINNCPTRLDVSGLGGDEYLTAKNSANGTSATYSYHTSGFKKQISLGNSLYTDETKQFAYKASDKTVKYRLLIDTESKMGADGKEQEQTLVIRDILPDGMDYVDGSVKARFRQTTDPSYDNNDYDDGHEHNYHQNEYNYVNFSGGKPSEPKALVTEEDGHKVLTITISPYYYDSVYHKFSLWYSLTYENDSFWNDLSNTDRQYINSATFNGSTKSVEVDIHRDDKKLEKTARQLKDSQGNYRNLIDYQILINTAGEDLNKGGDTLTLTDRMVNQYNENSNSDMQPEIDLSSVKLYEFDPSNSGPLGNKISHNRYTVTYDTSLYMLTIVLPDGLPCVLTYSYKINKDLSNGGKICNLAKLEGQYTDKIGTELKKVSSSASAYQEVIKFQKVDKDNYNVVLPGTKFKVEEYTNSSWNETWDPISDDSGVIKFDMYQNGKNQNEAKKDTLYRITETEALKGYKAAEGKVVKYFVWLGQNSNADTVYNNIKSSGIDKSDIQFVSSTGGTFFIENVYQGIRVNKVWLDEKGKETSNAPDSITVRLYRLKSKGKKEEVKKDISGHTVGPITLTKANGWSGEWTDLPAVDSKGKTIKYVVEEDKVNGYKVSYSSNNTDGITTGVITITNQESPEYVLPATGSKGTTWIYLLGSIILLLGAEWYLLTHKEVSRK